MNVVCTGKMRMYIVMFTHACTYIHASMRLYISFVASKMTSASCRACFLAFIHTYIYVPILSLVASKIDLSERSRVPNSEAIELARRHDLEFFQVSAHTNANGECVCVWEEDKRHLMCMCVCIYIYIICMYEAVELACCVCMCVYIYNTYNMHEPARRSDLESFLSGSGIYTCHSWVDVYVNKYVRMCVLPSFGSYNSFQVSECTNVSDTRMYVRKTTLCVCACTLPGFGAHNCQWASAYTHVHV